MIVVPYTYYDGIPTFRDSEIMNLYCRIIADGTGYMFADGQISDQESFLIAMKKSICGIVKDGESTAGVGWLNRIEDKKASFHFVVFKEYWGNQSVDVGRALCQFMLSIKNGDEYMFDMIWGMVPTSNRLAVKYLKRCGAVTIGELPCGLWDDRNKKSIPAMISYITRNEL